MNAARVAGVTVVLDPAPVLELPEGFIEAADIVVPNQIEAEAVTGVPVDASNPPPKQRKLSVHVDCRQQLSSLVNMAVM